MDQMDSPQAPHGPADAGDFVQVPILRKFGEEEVIGWLRIRSDALPPLPDFTFSLGYQVLDGELVSGEGADIRYRVTKYRLLSVAPVNDESMVAYIRKFGNVPDLN